MVYTVCLTQRLHLGPKLLYTTYSSHKALYGIHMASSSQLLPPSPQTQTTSMPLMHTINSTLLKDVCVLLVHARFQCRNTPLPSDCVANSLGVQLQELVMFHSVPYFVGSIFHSFVFALVSVNDNYIGNH